MEVEAQPIKHITQFAPFSFEAYAKVHANSSDLFRVLRSRHTHLERSRSTVPLSSSHRTVSLGSERKLLDFLSSASSTQPARVGRRSLCLELMAYRFDPRGDLPPSTIQSTYHHPALPHRRRDDNVFHGTGARSRIFKSDERNSYAISRRLPDPRMSGIRQPANILLAANACHDWIFSSASNIHVAIDRSAFKTYTPFKSYVLRVADQSPVKVRGIGTVELKIRRQPGSKENHTITLENVLHVPKWICNVFSDIYFEPINTFEHTWTDFGVSFLKKEDGQLNYWGFTEGFLGLERLVLAKKIQGRSPMLEDQDREVFSVNLSWPQGQRDKWEAQLAAYEKTREERKEARIQGAVKSDLTEVTKTTSPNDTSTKPTTDLPRQHRRRLNDLSTNIFHRRDPSGRTSSLKAPTTRSRASSFKEGLETLV